MGRRSGCWYIAKEPPEPTPLATHLSLKGETTVFPRHERAANDSATFLHPPALQQFVQQQGYTCHLLIQPVHILTSALEQGDVHSRFSKQQMHTWACLHLQYSCTLNTIDSVFLY